MSSDLARDYLDRILHELWQRAPASLLRLALGDPDLRVREIVEGKTVVLRKDVDSAAILESRHGPCVGHVEFETDADPDALPARIAMYGAVLYAKTGLPVRSAVLVLEPAPAIPERFEVRHGPDLLTVYHFRVLRLYEVPAAALAADPQLAVLAPFGLGVSLEDIAAARDTLRAHALPAERADRMAALYILGGRHFPLSALRRILSQEAYMESVTYREILDRGFEKGIEKGIEKGEAQGVRKGILLGVRNIVDRQIQRRFPDASSLFTPLLDRCSAEDLEEVGDAVLTAESAEALRAVLVALVGEP